MSKWVKFNINEYIKVKLTELGKRCWKDDVNRWAINSNYSLTDSEIEKRKDEEGFHIFQLHYFMNLFGQYTTVGFKNVIEDNILYFELEEDAKEEATQRGKGAERNGSAV